MEFFERVRNVLEKDQTEDRLLLLGGVHRAAQRIGRRPQRRLESKISDAVLFGRFRPLAIPRGRFAVNPLACR